MKIDYQILTNGDTFRLKYRGRFRVWRWVKVWRRVAVGYGERLEIASYPSLEAARLGAETHHELAEGEEARRRPFVLVEALTLGGEQ